MAPIKNHALLIESFALLPEKMAGQSLELLIVGEGECKNEIEDQVRAAGMTSRVHFRSWVEDLRWAYAAMDLFALTSRNEGMPIAVMEAMASGVSTVSMAVGGVVDLIRNGDTGILVSEYTSKSFSSNLGALLLDKRIREGISERAQKYIQEMHSEVSLTQKTLSMYRELLN
jgi:glycosyltransferase involved in cell wall biosynthesis